MTPSTTGQVTDAREGDAPNEGPDDPVSRPSQPAQPRPTAGAFLAVANLHPGAGQTGCRPRRILVVDDNVDSADMLGDVLRDSGHEVVIAHDPGAALAMFEPFRPEVAILDIGLPIMDGYELAERIRATVGPGGCRLIAMTGYGQDYDRARSARSGFANHLIKPVDLDALAQLIDTL